MPTMERVTITCGCDLCGTLGYAVLSGEAAKHCTSPKRTRVYAHNMIRLASSNLGRGLAVNLRTV